MPFLLANQQRQSTEGITDKHTNKTLSHIRPTNCMHNISIRQSDSFLLEKLLQYLHHFQRLTNMPLVLWRCWLGGRKGIRPVKTEWWGTGMVIFLVHGANLHMAQLMPLPHTISCFIKIQTGFAFLVPAHPGSPGEGTVKRVCVCVLQRLTNKQHYQTSNTGIQMLHTSVTKSSTKEPQLFNTMAKLYLHFNSLKFTTSKNNKDIFVFLIRC